MKWLSFVIVVMVAVWSGRALAINVDQGMPGKIVGPHAGVVMSGPMTGETQEAFERKGFEGGLDFSEFRLLAMAHQDQVKILDSWARQSIAAISHSQSLEGQDPVYTALDMTFRPEVWEGRNIVYVQAIPIRQQLAALAGKMGLGNVEADRILHTGLMSPRFLSQPEVDQMLKQVALDTRLSQWVGKILVARDTFRSLGWTLQIVPPPPGSKDGMWHHPVELMGNLPETVDEQKSMGMEKPLPELAGYSHEQALKIKLAVDQMKAGWGSGDAGMVNVGMKSLAAILPGIDAGNYPGMTKRVVELWYNRTFYGTIANVFLYFTAMALFMVAGIGGVMRVWKPAMWVFAVAVGLHVAVMGVRWWLAGRIPIQNQFESVLGSAMVGCVVGLLLEMWRKKGLFGLAFSFVGFLAMTACMSAPYVFGREIGGPIGKVAGILQTYWLYIHVNIVISSYALIAASFVLGTVYLGVRLWYWVSPIEAGDDSIGSGSGGRDSGPGGTVIGDRAALNVAAVREVEAGRAVRLEMLDQANMVVLQMAMWFLGIGIFCGAVWADQSWGRPWGWDPKETFALVTWIVYLIIVHARFVVPASKGQATMTAWMAVAGFAVMMFNWVGVNFFLAGLHSYA